MPKPLLDDTPWHGRHLAARWWPATACKKKPTKSTLCNANKAEVSVSNKNHFLNSLGEGNNKDRKDGLIFHLGFHLWMPNEESLQAVVAKKVEKPATAITLHGSSRNCHHWWWWRAQKDCIECTFFSYGLNAHLAGLLPTRPPLSSSQCSTAASVLLIDVVFVLFYSMSLGQNSASQSEVVF